METIMKYQLTPVQMSIIKTMKEKTSGKPVKNKELSHAVRGTVGITIAENSMEISEKA